MAHSGGQLKGKVPTCITLKLKGNEQQNVCLSRSVPPPGGTAVRKKRCGECQAPSQSEAELFFNLKDC